MLKKPLLILHGYRKLEKIGNFLSLVNHYKYIKPYFFFSTTHLTLTDTKYPVSGSRTFHTAWCTKQQPRHGSESYGS